MLLVFSVCYAEVDNILGIPFHDEYKLDDILGELYHPFFCFETQDSKLYLEMSCSYSNSQGVCLDNKEGLGWACVVTHFVCSNGCIWTTMFLIAHDIWTPY